MKKVYMPVVFIMLCVVMMAGCSQNSKKRSSAGQTAVSNMSTADSAHTNTVPRSQSPDAIDPALLALYKGVSVTVTDMKTGKTKDVFIGFNTPTVIEGTPLTVEVVQFFPDFMMSSDGYFTQSDEPNNVAAKVNITGSEPEFSGWLFARFPDVHPYDNPDFNITLKDAVKK